MPVAHGHVRVSFIHGLRRLVTYECTENIAWRLLDECHHSLADMAYVVVLNNQTRLQLDGAMGDDIGLGPYACLSMWHARSLTH